MAAIRSGAPVVPVFILDEVFKGYGAAPLWRFGLGVEAFAKTLEKLGSRLILRRGPALDVLQALTRETGARAVHWNRAYDPAQIVRDRTVKSALQEAGVAASSHPGHLMFEPWSVQTKDGGFYKVYSPFWRAVAGRGVSEPLARPGNIPAPLSWPESEDIGTWRLGAGMRRGKDVVTRHVLVGEDAAVERLGAFVADRIGAYKARRDFPGEEATSRLSENLAWGEISPATCWHAAYRAREEGAAGAEHFLKELVWREFAYHLVYHTPQILQDNWREGWDAFPWNEDAHKASVRRWKQGMTGVRFVDAAMREMYVSGTMHNRARMVVASYLTKHLLSHWRIGQRWFEDCLIDWDPASNAMGWQWVAGSGPDAAPYFRVFNPDTQLQKFDPEGAYQRQWLAETETNPTLSALSYFDAVPLSWKLSPQADYPEPVVDLAAGRARALAAYENRGF